MKNKERWLLSLKHYDGEGHAYDEGKIIHVIDATGMPTKEELTKALADIHYFYTEDRQPEMVKLLEWLDSLASE